MGSAVVLDLRETCLRANKKIGNGDVKEAKTPGCTALPWFLCSPSHSCLPDQYSELNVTEKDWGISQNLGDPKIFFID